MSGLIRDPAEWATSSGWVSRLRAERAAERLRSLAPLIREYYDSESDGGEWWADELEAVAKYLAPKRKGA